MSIKLVILGLLMEGEKHPYEIAQVMKERLMENYIKLPKGSIYYAFDQLQKKDMIEVVDVIRDSNRPDRTIYRITPRGEEEFQQLLIRQFSCLDNFYHPLYAALVFARHGNPTAIAEVLEERIQIVEESVQRMQQVYEEHISQVSRATLHMMMGTVEQGKTELKWLKRIRKDALEGRLQERGRPILLKEEERGT
ncbi:PadR family transcriptional regulator [Salinithrix halophila]|uniref:PadR family transcriptional regulator n=1 Tax=Salinithrix halophila TaxID=1485204 RepID=A0ABV8JH33_9BACL